MLQAQRKGSLVHTIGMLGQETRTGTNVMFASPHDEAEELCLGSVGAPVMEVRIALPASSCSLARPYVCAYRAPHQLAELSMHTF